MNKENRQFLWGMIAVLFFGYHFQAVTTLMVAGSLGVLNWIKAFVYVMCIFYGIGYIEKSCS
jgi:hypothetical protein